MFNASLIYEGYLLSQCISSKLGFAISIHSLYDDRSFYGSFGYGKEAQFLFIVMLLMLFDVIGRRDFEEGDLRDKIGRRHSPRRIHSPVRDARGRNMVREYSRSGSLDTDRESDRKHKKKQRLDGQSDISGSLRTSDAAEYQATGGKFTTDSRAVLVKQLKQVGLDIERLDYQKSLLGVKLEEKVQEVDSLTSKSQELEAQLYKEREENKRMLSKISKFVKAHNRFTQIQDELNRSKVWLHKLGDELASDINKIGANEEDSSINIVSDGEATGFLSPHDEQHNGVFQSNMRQDVAQSLRESKQADLTKAHVDAPVRLKKVSRWNIPAQSNYEKEIGVVARRSGQSSPLGNEGKHESRKVANVLSAEKLKSSDSGLVLPSTSMAAHAVDEVEIELEDSIGVVGTASTRVENESKGLALPLPPPLPILTNKYSQWQYEGGDVNIDVDGVEEEMVQLDIV